MPSLIDRLMLRKLILDHYKKSLTQEEIVERTKQTPEYVAKIIEEFERENKQYGHVWDKRESDR